MARAIPRELRHGHRALSDWPRYGMDVVASRLLRAWPSMSSADCERQVETRDGIRLTYRRNRGDIQGIREVFLEEHYRIPSLLQAGTLVDLGANIGLTALWFAKRYGVGRIVGVEPVGANVAIARRNLADNHVEAEIVQAAIGPVRGPVSFAPGSASNLGRVGPGSLQVEMITMHDVLERLGSTVDLLKVDIEGGEAALFAGDLSWLDAVTAIVCELHPSLVDCEPIVARLAAHGFRYRPGSRGTHPLDMFTRDRTRL